MPPALPKSDTPDISDTPDTPDTPNKPDTFYNRYNSKKRDKGKHAVYNKTLSRDAASFVVASGSRGLSS